MILNYFADHKMVNISDRFYKIHVIFTINQDFARLELQKLLDETNSPIKSD